MKILLADDQPEVRSLVAEMLQDQGHDLLSFADGRQAFEGAASQPFDLLITDFDMPGFDGVELCRRLRQERPALPAILLSSRCGQDGWHPSEPMICLEKPFRRQQLLEAIEEAQGMHVAEAPQGMSTGQSQAETGQRALRRATSWGLAAALLVAMGWGSAPSLLQRLAGPPSLPEPLHRGVQRDANLQLMAHDGVLAQLPDAAAWQTLPNATAYQLRFETVDGQIVFETRTDASPWTLPEALRSQLPSNVAFYWQVEAVSDSGGLLARSPRTRFRVLAPLDVDASTASETLSDPPRTP